MGIEDRSYYRDENQQRPFVGFGSGGSGGPKTVIVWLIIINTVIWIISAFVPINKSKLAKDFDRLDTDSNGFIEQGSDDPIESFAFGQLELADKNKDQNISRAEFDKAMGTPWLTELMSLQTDTIRKPWEIWRFVTYGFAHAHNDFFHLLFNMLGLFFLGRAIEDKLGSEEFLKFYLIAIVISGLVWLIVNVMSNQNAMVVGASGAVSAVVGLFVFSYPRQMLLLFFAIPIPAWVLGVILVIGDVFRAMSTNSSVAGEAHLAGFAFAAAYHYLNLNFHWIRTDFFKSALKKKPMLKVHQPEQLADMTEKLSAQADEILKKVHEQGEESLSRRERKILIRHSREVRKNKL